MLRSSSVAPGLPLSYDHSWHKENYTTYLGVASGKGIWFWFVLCDTELVFDHAYSQNTGFTSRSYEACVRAEKLLCRLAGLDWCVASSLGWGEER